MQAGARCASCLGPVAVEGGVPETRTHNKTTVIEVLCVPGTGPNALGCFSRRITKANWHARSLGQGEGQAPQMLPEVGVLAPILETLSALCFSPLRGHDWLQRGTAALACPDASARAQPLVPSGATHRRSGL